MKTSKTLLLNKLYWIPLYFLYLNKCLVFSKNDDFKLFLT